jgi:hypothetical protein
MLPSYARGPDAAIELVVAKESAHAHSARLIRGTARLSDCRLLHTPAPPPQPRGAALGVLAMEGVDASGGDPVGGRAIGCSFTEPSGRAGLSGKEMSSPLEGYQSSR